MSKVKVKEKVKLGMTDRKVSKDFVKILDIPDKAKIALCKVYSPRLDELIEHKYYNGGGNLVNYGLNTFVKDFYSVSGHVIFSDRFGNFSNIVDKQVAEIISDSSVCVSAEGVILFYNNDYIYATLNCKVGCIINTLTLFGNRIKSTKININDIFVHNKITYAKVSVEHLSDSVSYYALYFSFKLYEAYGTQIELGVSKIKEKNVFETTNDTAKDLENFERYELDMPISSVKKSNNIVRVSNTTNCYPIEDFKQKFYTIPFCKTDEIFEPDEGINTTLFSYNGDAGIDNCINSFIKEIHDVHPHIYKKGGFLKKAKFERLDYTIVICDRFENQYAHHYNSKDTYSYIGDSFLFVSLEGVLIAIYHDYHKIYLLVSLDGIVWKKYDIKNMFNISDTNNINIYIEQKSSNDHILVYKYSENKNKLVCEYIMDFTFNFWDLYSSPVEVDFTPVEM